MICRHRAVQRYTPIQSTIHKPEKKAQNKSNLSIYHIPAPLYRGISGGTISSQNSLCCSFLSKAFYASHGATEHMPSPHSACPVCEAQNRPTPTWRRPVSFDSIPPSCHRLRYVRNPCSSRYKALQTLLRKQQERQLPPSSRCNARYISSLPPTLSGF